MEVKEGISWFLTNVRREQLLVQLQYSLPSSFLVSPMLAVVGGSSVSHSLRCGLPAAAPCPAV